MTRLLLKNIDTLYGAYAQPPHVLKGNEMAVLPAISNAWMACDDGRVSAFGAMDDFPGIVNWQGLEVVDCSGRSVAPCFADSHTHIVYAGNREHEFGDRLRGHSYQEIAARGGGILNSAAKLRSAGEQELFDQCLPRLREVILMGTGSIEIKSGYGLDLESELKMLRVIRRLRDLGWIPVKATFLGAHAVPPEFANNRTGYVDHLVNEMIPAVAGSGLADFIDVFCEANYFTQGETLKILEAGAKFGLRGKVHAEQLSHTGGILAGVQAAAISVDHLEYCNGEDMAALGGTGTIPTVLPGAAFFLDLPRPPARAMIDAGLPLALASDFNPGSSPSGNMKLMMSMACAMYKLTPEEAFNASTVNSAAAMALQGIAGCFSQGSLANFLLLEPGNTVTSLAYSFGSANFGTVFVNGRPFSQ